MNALIIAGHGAGDPGASGVYNGITYKEADETRKIAPIIVSELLRNGVKAELYDPSRNAYKDALSKTIDFSKKYDYLLEVHFNAYAQGSFDNKTKGVECFITTIEEHYDVEESICKAVSSFGLKNRGVKKKNFTVIQTAKRNGISSALLEVCFIDDPDDMKIYLANREQIGKSIAQAICEEFGINYSTGEKAEMSINNKPSSWAKEACDWAIKNGIVNGDENGDYKWQQPITKEQMALMLYRFSRGGFVNG